MLADQLDSGNIDFKLLQIFEELVRVSDRGVYNASFYSRNELIVSPLF